jgi:short-subunit dehydrogenase
MECASRDWNLYLTDLDSEKLERLAKGLTRSFGVKILHNRCDLVDPESREVFWQHVQNLGIRFHMLINVAGVDFEGAFLSRNYQELETIIRLNVEATVMMTRRMLEFRDLNDRTFIINVSSLAGFYPMPLKAVYAATKRFLLDFSRAMHKELRRENVRMLALCPAGLATRKDTINSIQSQGFAGEITTIQTGKVAARTINRALAGYSVYIPGLVNQLLKTFGSVVPVDWVAWMIMRRWTKTRELAAQVGAQNLDINTANLVSISSLD